MAKQHEIQRYDEESGEWRDTGARIRLDPEDALSWIEWMKWSGWQIETDNGPLDFGADELRLIPASTRVDAAVDADTETDDVDADADESTDQAVTIRIAGPSP